VFRQLKNVKELEKEKLELKEKVHRIEKSKDNLESLLIRVMELEKKIEERKE
jgi:hypothetical protein